MQPKEAIMARTDPFAAPSITAINEERLGQLARYANLMQNKQAAVAAAEEQLKQLKKELVSIEQESIPAFMQELGLSSITLTDGKKIKLTTKVYASIPAKHYEEAMDWLVNNGHADLIKLTVTGQFGKDEYTQAKTIYDELTASGAKVSSKEAVHPSTLASFLKEQLERGTAIPLELFGAMPITKAVIS